MDTQAGSITKAQAIIWSMSVNPGQQEINREKQRIRESLLNLQALIKTNPIDPDIRLLIDLHLKTLIKEFEALDRIEIFGTLFEGPPEGVTATEVTATGEIPQINKLGLFSRNK